MPERIFEFKPKFFGFQIDLLALWRRIFSRVEPTSPVEIVAKRFLQLFEDHGVSQTQIQQFLPQLTLEKFKNTETLLEALTNEVLDQTSKLFQVRRTWLDGEDDKIYDCFFCYKNPELFFEILKSISEPKLNVRAFYSGKQLDFNDGSEQSIVIIFLDKIREIGDKEIFRFRICNDLWNWSYPPCRIQLKAMVRMYGKIIPLYKVASNVLEKIREGKLIPRNYFGILINDPSLEDYVQSPRESVVAKEFEELPVILKYIAEHDLERFTQKEQTPNSDQ